MEHHRYFPRQLMIQVTFVVSSSSVQTGDMTVVPHLIFSLNMFSAYVTLGCLLEFPFLFRCDYHIFLELIVSSKLTSFSFPENGLQEYISCVPTSVTCVFSRVEVVVVTHSLQSEATCMVSLLSVRVTFIDIFIPFPFPIRYE